MTGGDPGIAGEDTDRLIRSVPVPLAWLASLDDCASPHALPDAVGDRYLMRHNRVFASIRQATVDAGYTFSASESALWRDYQFFSLTTLRRIYSQKIIPYSDTWQTLARLLETSPKMTLSPRFIMGSFKKNHAFHEGAHCVADSVLQTMERAFCETVQAETERLAVRSLLTEAFANAVETLGTLEEYMPLSDAIFYSLNSYMAARPKKSVILRHAGTELGEAQRFKLLFLGSLEANLSTGKPEASTYERVRAAAGISAGHSELAASVVDIGFQLNDGFRDSTTPEYFRLLGCEREYLALRGSNWLKDRGHREFVDRLTQVLFETLTDFPADPQ